MKTKTKPTHTPPCFLEWEEALGLVKKAPFKNVIEKLAVERIHGESLASQAYIKRRISNFYFKKRGEDESRVSLKDCISFIRTLQKFQKRSMDLIQHDIIIKANKK